MNSLRKAYTAMAEQYNDPQKLFKWMVAIVLCTVGYTTWMDAEMENKLLDFIPVAQGREMMEKAQDEDTRLAASISVLADEMKISNGLLMLHLDRERFDNVNNELKTNETNRINTEQWISVNGETERDRVRLRQLKAEHEDLEERKRCIIDNNPLCD